MFIYFTINNNLFLKILKIMNIKHIVDVNDFVIGKNYKFYKIPMKYYHTTLYFTFFYWLIL